MEPSVVRGSILACLFSLVVPFSCGGTTQGDRTCRDQSNLGEGGRCPASLTGCVIFGWSPTNTCTELCMELGESCVVRGCDGLTARGFSTETSCRNNEFPIPDSDSADGCGVSLLNVVVGCCCTDSG